MNWSYRKNLIGKVRIYYSSGCVGPVQIPLDELADELNDYEARIAELEADIEAMKKRLAYLESWRLEALADDSGSYDSLIPEGA